MLEGLELMNWYAVSIMVPDESIDTAKSLIRHLVRSRGYRGKKKLHVLPNSIMWGVKGTAVMGEINGS